MEISLSTLCACAGVCPLQAASKLSRMHALGKVSSSSCFVLNTSLSTIYYILPGFGKHKNIHKSLELYKVFVESVLSMQLRVPCVCADNFPTPLLLPVDF
jgi:hypothetical protein